MNPKCMHVCNKKANTSPKYCSILGSFTLKMLKGSENEARLHYTHDMCHQASIPMHHEASLLVKPKHILLSCFILICQNKVEIKAKSGTTGLDCVAPGNRHPKGVSLEVEALLWQSPWWGHGQLSQLPDFSHNHSAQKPSVFGCHTGHGRLQAALETAGWGLLSDSTLAKLPLWGPFPWLSGLVNRFTAMLTESGECEMFSQHLDCAGIYSKRSQVILLTQERQSPKNMRIGHLEYYFEFDMKSSVIKKTLKHSCQPTDFPHFVWSFSCLGDWQTHLWYQ